MKVTSINRGFNETRDISSVSFVVEVRLADSTFIRHNMYRRPLSNVGYGHAIESESGSAFEQVSADELSNYLTDTLKELRKYSDHEVRYFKFTWSALDTSHGRLTRSIESKHNKSFQESLKGYKAGSKLVLAWSKLQ